MPDEPATPTDPRAAIRAFTYADEAARGSVGVAGSSGMRRS